jgi:hypothetical protein
MPAGRPPQGALNRLALGSRITTSKVTRFAPDPHSDTMKNALRSIHWDFEIGQV